MQVGEAASFLENVSSGLTMLRDTRRRYAPRLAPDFNVLGYDRTDELRLSRLLADLLDPRGTHGQGSRFLKLFLGEICGISIKEEASKGARVKTEVATSHLVNYLRRLDIVIELDGLALGIENKPWASDQETQIEDYVSELARRAEDWRILYLSRDGSPPSAASVSPEKWEQWTEKDGHAQAISYSQVGEWLTSCIGLCESERVSLFLGDLRAYLTKEFEGVQDMAELEEIKKLALQDTAHLDAALTIGASIRAIKRALLVQLDEELSRLFELRQWKRLAPHEHDMSLDKRYSGLTVAFDDRHQFSWEFQQGNCDVAGFGLDQIAKECSYRDALVAALNQELGKGKTNDNWLWFRFVDEPEYWSWSTSSKPWLGILETGEGGQSDTARFILNRADQVNRVVQLVTANGRS